MTTKKVPGDHRDKKHGAGSCEPLGPRAPGDVDHGQRALEPGLGWRIDEAVALEILHTGLEDVIGNLDSL